MKKIIKIGFYTIFFVASCHSEEMMMINSDQAEYDGKQIILTGNVNLDHEVGKIKADKVKLTAENEDRKSHFSHLNMQDHVSIDLRDNGQLTCSHADIDSIALKGHFTGVKDQEFVIFTECSQRNKEAENIPLTVKSRDMTVFLDRPQSENEDLSVKSYIKEIEAQNGVIVNYNKDFIIEGDNGRYYRLPDNTSPDLVGLISLHESENYPCKILNRQGDNIFTSQITINTLHKTLSLAEPKGIIHLVSDDELQNEIVDFKADILLWNEPEGKIKLCDHIAVKHHGLSWTFTTDRDVEFSYYLLDGKKQIKTMESNGFIQLNSFDKIDTSILFSLSCYGKLLIDHPKLELIMTTEKAKIHTENENQIYFKDKMGEIYADQVKLFYMMKEKNIVPHRMVLEGNVRILNRHQHLNQQEALFQYAIADKAEYRFENKELKFTAENKNRVLFYDKINNLQVSAPGLRIKRDGVTKKDTIKGMGDVRFNFADEELLNIKKRFMLKDTKEEMIANEKTT